ncbi:single-strand DNA-binding protein [Lewinella aquimaris]|uniref:Single-stranded DNA-binding protein n=1 Tax=Neolewinella aquimaris TaxID=1835722 RepID=A0A840E5V1_9BACT|nr:single-stranded DNA-binding protein [Neolewinella aquimaris]MBB4078995.1 single-strand DNA-binding protein [Neolewinella aquimaris]
MNVRNSVTLIGNVGQLPITKTLPSGNRVIEFSLATNDSYRNREGEKVTRTEWHRVKAYGKLVDTLERYLTKGTQIALTGMLRYNKWTDKYEQQRSSAEIILEEFTFLSAKERSTSDADHETAEMEVAEPAPKKTSKRRATKKSEKTSVTPAEDLPF